MSATASRRSTAEIVDRSGAGRPGDLQAPVREGLGNLIARFRRDTSGNIAMIFGLTIVSVVALVGGAVDYGRWLNARYQMQGAIDAAVLAAGRVLQTEGADEVKALDAANKYYAQMKSQLTVRDTVQFIVTDSGTAVEVTGGAAITTPFLSIVGIPELPLTPSAKAILAVGGDAENNLEIAMMLDVTGSMGGQKLVDLKAAAKDLIDIVVWDDQSEYYSKIALVPFSVAVNVGATTAPLVRGTYLPGTCNTPGCFKYKHKNKSGSNVTETITNCVTERTGADAYKDTAPLLSPVGRHYGSCSPSSTIVPLSKDRTALKNAIDNYSAAGVTAGHLGTAWAWYMLSPNWGYLWPLASRPAAYGTDKLQKIAILMTDGEYNAAYCNGVVESNINCSSPNGNPTSQAAQLCTGMKAKGITVYTIGFALGGNTTALNMLRNCATAPEYFYESDDGDQLRRAFREIALKISTLRISQ